MIKAVIKFLNGEEIQATIQFFNANKPAFPVTMKNEQGKEEIRSIQLFEIKAIFFLKEKGEEKAAEGPHLHTETIDQTVYAGSVATKLLVEFKDGEILHGSTLRYYPSDKGFFLTPLNPGDASDRIYVNAQAVKRVERTKLLGRILEEQQKITSGQLEEALANQREKREKRIGTILMENDIISEKQLDDSLKKQKQKYKMLGEILVEAGYITQEQLNVALKIQQDNRKKKLGEILVELNYVTPNDICIVLSAQLKLPWMDLSKENIPAEIAATLSEEIVRKFEILPVGIKDGRILIVASANPLSTDLAQELHRVTPMIIRFVIVFDSYLSAAIDRFFPPKKQDAADPASGNQPPPATGPPGKSPPVSSGLEK